jgi:2,4-dienoyl-CoA reductase-like NADH-dependent reductase (Old Yellow Enzyme family)
MKIPQPLLQPGRLGDLLLPNRVVMAPLTRGRASNRQQGVGWKAIPDAIHAKAGRIFAQLWHQGAVLHPSFFHEIAPPWVQTDLLGSNHESRAMPLPEFIEETIKVLGTDVHEVLVERAKPLRNNPGPNEGVFVTEFNDLMARAPG